MVRTASMCRASETRFLPGRSDLRAGRSCHLIAKLDCRRECLAVRINEVLAQNNTSYADDESYPM
jgi:hypothetical protein